MTLARARLDAGRAPIMDSRTVDLAAAALLALLGWLAVQTVPALIWPMTALLFLLGAPHGAVVRRHGQAHRPGGRFITGYLTVAALVLMLFLAMPILGLAGFFALSAWHFARAEQQAGLGLFATFAAFLLAPVQTKALIAVIVGTGAAIDALMYGGAMAAMAGIMLVAWSSRKGLRADMLERLGLLLLLFALLPPLMAMGIYFFALHSLAEYRAQAPQGRPCDLSLCWPIGLPVIFGGALLYLGVANGLLPLVLLTGLALALAMPHMLDEALLQDRA